MFNEMKKLKNRTALNSKKLYDFIYHNYPISKSRLKDISGFTLTTLNRAMDLLISENLICVSSIGKSNGGRKPSLYSINALAAYVISIDISQNYVRIVLMDLELNILKSVVFGVLLGSDYKCVFNKIYNTIEAFYKEFDKEKILGVGMGVTRYVNIENMTILNQLNFSTLKLEHLLMKRYLEKKVKLVTINSASAAVLGECIKGVGKNVTNVAYIILGEDVKLGIVHDNKVFDNPNINEGAFGHMIIDINGKKCSCGKKGCLKSYVSIKAILDNFKQAIKDGEYSKLAEEVQYDLSQINIDNFSNAVKNNDKLAIKTIDTSAEYLSIAIINLINVLNFDLIILDGTLINKCAAFYNIVVEKINKRLIEKKVIFSKGILKDDAIVIGVGNKVLDYWFK